jgi:putative transposase
VVRRVRFRLYPKSAAARNLLYARQLHKHLYNAAIANRKTQYERFGHSVNYYEQQNSLPAFKPDRVTTMVGSFTGIAFKATDIGKN